MLNSQTFSPLFNQSVEGYLTPDSSRPSRIELVLRFVLASEIAPKVDEPSH
jgi:hypothetical protein